MDLIEYCGPYISDGNIQESTCGYTTASGPIQQSCKEHDCAFHKYRDLSREDKKVALRKANDEFISEMGRHQSLTASALGAAVGATRYGEPRLRGPRHVEAHAGPAHKVQDVGNTALLPSDVPTARLVSGAPSNKPVMSANKSKSRENKKPNSGISKTIRAPTSMTQVIKPNVPKFKAKPNGSIVIQNRELLYEMAGNSGVYTSVGFSLNPGLFPTFQWLSSIAARYEKYRFNKLEFHFDPECATTTAGCVTMCVDYDAADPAPGSKQAASGYDSYVKTAPWAPAKLVLPQKSLRPLNFTRAGSLPANLDVKTYDIGTLWLANNVTGAGQVGDIYVVYEVEFEIPQTSALSTPFSQKIVVLNGISASTPWGTSWTDVGSLNVSVNGTGDSLVFAIPGTYIVTVLMQSTVTAYSNTGSTATINVNSLVQTNMVYIVTTNAANQTLKMTVTGSLTQNTTYIALFNPAYL